MSIMDNTPQHYAAAIAEHIHIQIDFFSRKRKEGLVPAIGIALVESNKNKLVAVPLHNIHYYVGTEYSRMFMLPMYINEIKNGLQQSGHSVFAVIICSDSQVVNFISKPSRQDFDAVCNNEDFLQKAIYIEVHTPGKMSAMVRYYEDVNGEIIFEEIVHAVPGEQIVGEGNILLL